MTAERRDGPTPHGGAYSLAVYMNLKGWVEVPKEQATGIVITEYNEDGTWLYETVASITGSQAATRTAV